MKTILFVDDHQVLARLSTEILEMQGYKAAPAHSYEEAETLMTADPVDCVVLDWQVEGAKETGLQFARRMREKYPKLYVVIMTGWGHEVDGKEFDKQDKCNLFPELLTKIHLALKD